MNQPLKHSAIVGGSTARRVINCPGSVALVAKMPPQIESVHMRRGTMLHEIISKLVDGDNVQLNADYTLELHEEKITPALALFNTLDPKQEMEYDLETNVHFGDFMPGVFGSADVIGRIGNTAYVIDWKFGDGVIVDAEENEQLMFYAAAAMRTPGLEWAFKGVTAIECVIIQPPALRKWTTTPARIQQFEQTLHNAVTRSQQPHAPTKVGDHCKFCTAKTICPSMNSGVTAALTANMTVLTGMQVAAHLNSRERLREWDASLDDIAIPMLESGVDIPGWKLVAKRAVRSWTDETQAKRAILDLGVKETEITETNLLSPAKVEKVLKKHKLDLPAEVVSSVSSGSTLAKDSDPRPAVVTLAPNALADALTKLKS